MHRPSGHRVRSLIVVLTLMLGFAAAAVAPASAVSPSTPAIPTSLAAIRGYSSAEISFTAGANGGAAITNYKYQLDSGSWVAFSPAVTTSPVTIGGLTNGTTYSVKLRAVNTNGDGAISDPVSVTPAPVTIPTSVGRLATEDSWQAIAYGNGTFVAVADDGTNRVMTSADDGVTWTPRTVPEANSWQAVAYGNGTFVAVAGDGTHRVMTSTDNGASWTAQTAAEGNYWRGVTYANGKFVAVSIDGTHQVMTSPDGVTWTAQTAAVASRWYQVTYGNGKFVALAVPPPFGAAPKLIMTSADGVTWAAQDTPEVSYWRSITFGNGTFVAVANYTANTHKVMTSTDGVTWTARDAAEDNSWFSVTYGNGLFVAVAASGTRRVMTSPDGITWTAQSAAAANSWYSVAYGNGRFVSVASTGTNRVMTGVPVAIPDAPTSLVATPGNGSASIAFTAGSANGSAITKYQYTKNDGTNWYDVSSGGTSSPSSITGLTNGTTYSIKLRAYNGIAGTASAAVSVTPAVPFTAPAAPTSLVATPGNGSASIAFTPGANGGNAITKYQYQIGSGSWLDAPAGTTSPVVITGLTNYTTVSIKLRAYNSAGGGTQSTAVSVTPKLAAPVITMTYTAKLYGFAQRGIYVGFNGVSPAGTKVVSYRAYAYAKGTTTVVSTVLIRPTDRGAFLTGLTNGVEYDIRVIAFLTLNTSPHITRGTLESATRTVRV